MEYAVLAEAYARAEATTKRLELTQIVAGLLDETPLPLIGTVVDLSQGRLAPESAGVELGVAEKLVVQAIAKVAGVTEDEVLKERNRQGDIGSAAEGLLGQKAQATLFASALTVQHVHEKLMEMASASGSGSQDKKLKILRLLLSEAEPLEVRYLVRTVTGKLRLGIQDATVLDALAALVTDGEVVSVTDMQSDARELRERAKAALEHANDVASDLARVAMTALAPSKEAARRLKDDEPAERAAAAIEALSEIKMTIGTPLRAMLAERLSSPAEILEKLDDEASLEYKYDGLRVQAHISKDGTVTLWSRRLEDLTAQFPDVARALAEAFPGKDAIVEGEAVAIDAETGRMLPFQAVSRRRGRKYGITERREAAQSAAFGVEADAAARGAQMLTEFPIKVFLFDLLLLDGDEWMERPYRERRAQLEELVTETDRVTVAATRTVTDVDGIDAFLRQALADGAEGLMAKHLEGRYKAGTRAWQWIKFKADYVEDLADTLDLAVVGAFHGQGRRKGWYGAFLLAAWNPDASRFETVCRVATGFDDQELAELHERLAERALEAPPTSLELRLTEKPDVWFEPELVMEVSGAEITLSPVHSCAWGQLKPDAGLAVRFPRYLGPRDDKAPEETTAPEEVVVLYERQVKVRAPSE